MEDLSLTNIELEVINYATSIYNANLYGEYTDLLKAVCQGNYELALSSEITSQLLRPGDGVDMSCINAQSLQVLLEKNITEFLSVDKTSVCHLRQRVVLSIGVSCLQLFVQNNWVGPPTSCCLWPLYSSASTGEKPTLLCETIHSGLTFDEELVHQLSNHPLYLLISKIILWNCADLISECQTSGLWLMRFVKTLQSMMEERSPVLKNIVLQKLRDLSDKPLFNGSVPRTSGIQIQFHLEAGHLCYFYYESTMARDHFAMAEKLSQLSVKLTGMLGKRTRFQTRDISQLVLDVKLASVEQSEFTNSQQNPSKVDEGSLPKSIRLDDEAVLDAITLTNPENTAAVSIAAVQQAMILGMCHKHRRTHESEGQSRIVQEELMAFINCVLAQPICWCVQTMALLLRSRWEKDSARRMQRSLTQLEELVKQFSRKDVPGYTRLHLVYAVSLPPLWTIEQELGRLYDEIGAVGSALEVYLRLQSWEDVIGCYSKLGHRQKAENLIREQLAIKETANLWCYLGDVMSNPEHYHQAWKLSEGRNARSQRSLAYYYFNKPDIKESLQYFKKSLQLSPLQVGVWFTYGCACLTCEQFDQAAVAFRRCVNLDGDNFAAWSNLATSYIKANNKPRAFLTYQEALRCDFENWRIWENYLAVSVDVGEFEETIKAYHRLLELRNKHTDVAVLGVLVRAVCENLVDASGKPASKIKPQLLKLFGHITANVTNSAEIWSLYASLLTADETTDKTTLERALQCLKASHSCATLVVNWEKDVTKCVEICLLSHRLAAAYLKCVATSTDADRVKSSGKLMLKGILTKIRKQYNETLPVDLCEPINMLEDDLLSLANNVETQ